MSPLVRLVLLDANIWVSERLLRTSIGEAALHAIVGDHDKLVLPEVVEREVTSVLVAQAEKSASIIEDRARFFAQVTGEKLQVRPPSLDAVRTAIAKRWEDLGGVLTRAELTLDHARSALDKLVTKLPPCVNGEEFRDACIWHAALDLADSGEVHIVSGDKAFYEKQKYENGLATSLAAEMKALGRTVALHESLKAFLSAMGRDLNVDEKALARAIVAAVRPRAHELSQSSEGDFDIGPALHTEISGYATPSPGSIAVSFVATWAISKTTHADSIENSISGRLTLYGSCLYAPADNSVSDIAVTYWSRSVDKPGGGTTMMGGGDISLGFRHYI